jgi:preprotein translocase subunit SecB
MRKDNHPGIDFEKIILEKVNLETNPNYQKTEKGIPVDISFKVNRELVKSLKLLKLSFEVSLFRETSNPPFHISVLATGYFTVKRVKDIKALEEFSQIQAPALLFPFIREVIADLTMRTGYPPLLIPPTNIALLIGKTHNVTKKKNE